MTAPERRERRRLGRLHRIERELRAVGIRAIGGLDEVGRGPLAGPVVAACVVLERPLMLPGLDDSKRVPAARRERLADQIRGQALAFAIGEAGVAEIDAINIHRAGLLAMERALAALAVEPEFLLIDAFRVAAYAGPQRAIAGGDACCAAIAAASILAKVHRDRLLCELDALFPCYGFAVHKGYATAAHLQALAQHGPCPAHRRSFAPVRLALGARS
ncbi:MAG: ribonuclease HII [Vulcanimicrobiaceae bacterium]